MRNIVLSFIGLVVIVMSVPAFAKPLALVLSGGGAKGAYEVGVWKAMQEKGITKDVRVISGTSVGGLNATLFAAVDDVAKIEAFWTSNVGKITKDINLSKARSEIQTALDEADLVFQEREAYKSQRLLEESINWNMPIDKLPQGVFQQIEDETKSKFAKDSFEKGVGLIANGLHKIVKSDEVIEGWVDPSALQVVLYDCIPHNWSKDIPIAYATTLDKERCQTRVFKLNDEEPFDRKVDILRATSAIPVVFNNVVIDGRVYVDGGWDEKGGENVPITPIIEKHPEIDTIYVVYLNNAQTLRKNGNRIDITKYAGKHIVEIIPSKDLHGFIGAMDFDDKKTKQLIQLGYDDAINILEKKW